MSRRSFFKTPGVYSICCLKNNRVYIGQSGDIPSRWGEHLADLTRKAHANLPLQEDWSCFGLSGFTFSVLEILHDQTSRLEREKYHIRLNLSRCYNLEWDRTHTIQDGVIVNKLTRKPILENEAPPAETPQEDPISRWARMQRNNQLR